MLDLMRTDDRANMIQH